MPNRTGITIGVSYEGSKVSALKGTVNDSLNMARALTSKYGYSITNLNDRSYSQSHARFPSKTNIVFWMNKLLREAKDGDELFIGYAGHGVQLALSNSNTEELDKKDEAIIPADYDFKDSTAIIDDEILRILTTHLRSKPNCKLFMLFDCCHSGTMADLRYRFNYHHAQRDFTFYDNRTPNSFQSKVILISGCRDDQVSWGDLISLSGGAKARQGVMTSAFLHVIGRNPSSIQNVFEIVKEMYRYTSSYKQQPQISSNYDISKSQNSNLRNIIEYGSQSSTNSNTNSNTNPPVRPEPTRPTQTVVQPAAQPAAQPPASTPVNNRPSTTLSALLQMYANTNRYRYRYQYTNRYNNRYRYRNRYRSRDTENEGEIGSTVDVNYRNFDNGVRLRSQGSLPKMGDIIGMTL